MKVEIDYFGIKLVPESYQDKMYLVRFYKNCDSDGITSNLSLYFSKKASGGESGAGGDSHWKDYEEHYWEDEKYQKENLGRTWLPLSYEDLVQLEIHDRDL